MKLIAATAIITLMSYPAFAQNCAPRGDIVKKLNENYSETQRAVGVTSSGTALEVFAAESGSFTVIITRPDGISCIVSVGNDFTLLPGLKGDPA